MLPQLATISLDIFTLMIVVFAAVQVIRADIGGIVGVAFRFTLIGLAVLAINRFLDTFYFAELLQTYSSAEALSNISLIHKLVDLIGFIFIAIGYAKLAAANRSS
jgi:hypothetical protein